MFRVSIDTVKMLCAALAKKRRTSAVGKVQGVSLAFSDSGTAGFKWSTSPNIAVSSFAIVRVVLRLGGRFGAVERRSLRIVVRVSVKHISQRYRLRLVFLWCRANSWWWAVFCPVRALSIRLNRWQCTKSQ